MKKTNNVTRNKTSVKEWDCNKAIKETRAIAIQHGKTAVELIKKLYIAKEHLNSQMWTDFCEEIGMNRKTADKWLRKYAPNELINAGKKGRL